MFYHHCRTVVETFFLYQKGNFPLADANQKSNADASEDETRKERVTPQR